MRNIFSANEEPREVDPAFQSQADAQRGERPGAPATDVPFPGPSHFPVVPVTAEEVVARQPDLSSFFALAGPGSATEPAPPMPPVPHFELRPEFERLAARSAPWSVVK